MGLETGGISYEDVVRSVGGKRFAIQPRKRELSHGGNFGKTDADKAYFAEIRRRRMVIEKNTPDIAFKRDTRELLNYSTNIITNASRLGLRVGVHVRSLDQDYPISSDTETPLDLIGLFARDFLDNCDTSMETGAASYLVKLYTMDENKHPRYLEYAEIARDEVVN